MIIDAFPYTHEEAILDMRFNVLNGVVDKFVMVESTHTFTGQPRALEWPRIKGRFRQFMHKVDHLPITNLDSITDPDERQWHQKDRLREYVLEFASPRDICIFSDVDEIPNPEAICRYNIADGIQALHQQFFYYFLNLQVVGSGWWDAKILPVDLMRNFTAKEIRYFDGLRHRRVLYNAGWHFSSVGGKSQILKKAFYNHEAKPESKNEKYIERLLSDPLRPISEHMQLVRRSIDIHFPVFVQHNQQGLRDLGLIYDPPPGHPSLNYHEFPTV